MPFIQPEQQVLASGIITINSSQQASDFIMRDQGSTKTMRKLKVGDKLVLTYNTVTAAIGAGGQTKIIGTVQFFFKS